MADVRSDSRICIQDKSGTIKTVIFEEDFEPLGYKAAGWKPVKEDWANKRGQHLWTKSKTRTK